MLVSISARPVRRLEAKDAWGGKSHPRGHYADINGLKLYYEIHGADKQSSSCTAGWARSRCSDRISMPSLKLIR